MRALYITPILLGLLIACAPTQSRPGTPTRSPSRFVLTAVDMGARPWPSAYAAVEQLRPWLLSPIRGRRPAVLVDGMPGHIDDLKLIPAEVIQEIRYVEGAEAVVFPGAAATIVVTTRPRGGTSR